MKHRYHTQALPSKPILIELARRAARLLHSIDGAQKTQDKAKFNRAWEALENVMQSIGDVVTPLLVQGRDDVLEAALAELDENGHDDAADELGIEVELACTSIGQGPRTLLLLPVIAPVAALGRRLSREVCDRLSQVWNTHVAWPCIQAQFSDQVLTPAEVFDLSYSGIYNFYQAGGRVEVAEPTAAGGQTESDPIGLRFLVVKGEIDPDWVMPPDDEDAEGTDLSDAEMAWSDAIHAEGAVIFGNPCIFGVPGDMFEARESGMELHMMCEAKFSLYRQLTARGLFGAETKLFVSLHGDPTIGEDGIIEQMRISLVDIHGRLVAGHVISINDWFDPDCATDLVIRLSDDFGQKRIHNAPGLIDLSDDADEEPRFYTEAGWVWLSDAPQPAVVVPSRVN